MEECLIDQAGTILVDGSHTITVNNNVGTSLVEIPQGTNTNERLGESAKLANMLFRYSISFTPPVPESSSQMFRLIILHDPYGADLTTNGFLNLTGGFLGQFRPSRSKQVALLHDEIITVKAPVLGAVWGGTVTNTTPWVAVLATALTPTTQSGTLTYPVHTLDTTSTVNTFRGPLAMKSGVINLSLGGLHQEYTGPASGDLSLGKLYLYCVRHVVAGSPTAPTNLRFEFSHSTFYYS